jgi:hypothetical protein
MLNVRKWVIDLSIVLAAGVVLAALGPFDSYAIGGFAERLAYWLPATLIGYAIFRPTGALILWLAGRMHFPLWSATLVAVLLAAVPATAAIALFGGYRVDQLLPATALFPLYVNVALVGALIMAVFVLMQRPAAAPAEQVTTAPEQPPAPAFLDRLPPGFPQPLVALEMEDHYVRAHGQNGRSELVLLRMRDAVAELHGVAGERVHRSWWVARAAVTGKRRDGRNLVLTLDGGLQAPVARDRVADLKAKGWI